MFDRSGAVRPHWKPLVDAFASMEPDEYGRRLDSAMRMVGENGVTYNVYDEANGLGRQWQLDVAPFVISAADWTLIEAAVAQRARLVDAILRDIYGEQRLLRSGVVPSQLVYGHPQYLRALQDVAPACGVHVHLYSADLVRVADGSWRVLASRADAPSGLGYALENRIVVSQTFPELFGELGIQRLASFFRQFRDSVTGLAGERKGHAVLLTPGPYNEAYFEHAYLARYLGLELVEGDDLSVRDGVVYLRTLGGLARVSVIFRRLDSDFADPLEMRADSALGVPGLVDAIRARSVVVANALGGGVAESPALDAYLPNESRALFGEEVLFSDVPTVWCGTPWGRTEGLARARRGIVRDAFDARPLFSRGSSAVLGSDMDDASIARFADHIERRGATSVVQDHVPLGFAPTFERGVFASRPLSLRVFAAWTPNGYIVMPGGLGRVAADESVRALSMQSGAASKDVWAIAPGPIDTFSMLRPPRVRLEIRRGDSETPSRAMDNLLWLARYAERAENTIRLLRASLVRLAGETGLGLGMSAAEFAERLLLPQEIASEEAVAQAAAGDATLLADEMQEVIFGEERSGLQRLLARVARAAWSARDRLSIDTWRAIYALTTWDPLYAPAGPFDWAGARAYLDMLIRRAAALSGLSAENMTRGDNRLFFDLGRRIERAFFATGLVRNTLVASDERDSAAIGVALEIADSSMTYRYRYRNVFQAAPAVDLLLLDASNPRGVAFQIERIVHHAADLPMLTEVQRHGRTRERAELLLASISGVDPYALCEPNEDGERVALATLLAEVTAGIVSISEAVGDAYLQHLPRFRA